MPKPGVENMLGHAPPPLTACSLDIRDGHPALIVVRLTIRGSAPPPPCVGPAQAEPLTRPRSGAATVVGRRLSLAALISHEPLKLETGPTAARNDDVIMQDYVDRLTDADQLACHVDVGAAWFWITAGMVVDENKARCSQIEGAVDDRPREDRGGVDGALRHHLVGNQSVVGSQIEDPDLLSRPPRHVRPQIGRQFRSARNRCASERLRAEEMDHRRAHGANVVRQLRGLAKHPLEPPVGCCEYAPQAAEGCKKTLRSAPGPLGSEGPQKLRQEPPFAGSSCILRARIASAMITS